MVSNNHLVSVIITTFNREDFLEEALISVVNQTYKNIEIIVVDDGSKVNYAEKICSKYNNCHYYFKENGGISSARNFGVTKAKGEFVAFLDDDDLFKLNKIEKQLDVLINNPEYDLVHSSATIIEHNGKITDVTIGASNEKAHLRTGDVFWNALGRWCVKSPTPFLRKKIFDKVMFDEEIEVSEDFDFYQRLFYYFKVYYINESLAYYRDSDEISRLSKKEEKYVGVESQFFNNFLKMGIKNPFTLYKIALRLAQCGITNWNLYYKDNKIVVSKWKLFLNPFYYIRNLNKLSEKV